MQWALLAQCAHSELLSFFWPIRTLWSALSPRDSSFRYFAKLPSTPFLSAIPNRLATAARACVHRGGGLLRDSAVQALPHTAATAGSGCLPCVCLHEAFLDSSSTRVRHGNLPLGTLMLGALRAVSQRSMWPLYGFTSLTRVVGRTAACLHTTCNQNDPSRTLSGASRHHDANQISYHMRAPSRSAPGGRCRASRACHTWLNALLLACTPPATTISRLCPCLVPLGTMMPARLHQHQHTKRLHRLRPLGLGNRWHMAASSVL